MSGTIISTVKRLFGGKDRGAGVAAVEQSRARSSYVDAKGRPYAPINDGTLDRLSPKLKIREDALADIRSNMADLDRSFRSAVDLSQFSSSGIATTKTILAKIESDVGGQLQMEEERLAYRNRVSELEKELNATSLRLGEQAAISHASKTRLEGARHELEVLKNQVSVLQAEAMDNTALINQLQNAKDVLEADIILKRSALDDLEQQSGVMQEAMASLQAETATLRDASIGFEKEANEWKRMNDNNSHRLESTQSELRELRAISNDFQREKIDFESQLQIIKSEMAAENQRKTDLVHKKDARIYALEAKNESLEASVRILKQKMDVDKSDNAELMKSNTALQKQVAALKVKIDATRKLQEDDRNTIYKSGDRISELDLNISTIIADLNSANLEKQAQAKLMEELQQKNSELTDKVIRLSAIEERHEHLIRAIREKNDTASLEKPEVASPVDAGKKRNQRKSA